VFARVLILSLCSLAAVMAGDDLNDVVLGQIRLIPEGGGYGTALSAHQALASTVTNGDVHPERARPSYCSGATYLIFLLTLQDLQRKGAIHLSSATWEDLKPRLRPDGQDTLPDGESIWGRWNANGPGTARLFHELKLGRNFTDFAEARPGDFMKIFWTDAVGKHERGHSVIFLGLEEKDGVESVRYWSSNVPGGIGIATVPREKIAWAIFSRLTRPENVRPLTGRDEYLASLLKTESSRTEARKLSGIAD
jgi:hypothetical protein